jgi:hypothetical protein
MLRTVSDRIGTVLFFLVFLILGMIGARILAATFEPVRSEYLGASAFLFLLCLIVVLISTYAYVRNSRQDGRHSGWLSGFLGGAVAGGSFCGSVYAGYAGRGFAAVPLALLLPSLIGFLWPLLGVRRGDGSAAG